jgi:hypothetical protein
MVIRLIKRGDRYRPTKLAASVRGAGAKPAVVREVMKRVKVHNNMTTLALRKQVTKLLLKLDKKTAKKYRSFKKR